MNLPKKIFHCLFTMTKPLGCFVRKLSATDEIHFTVKQRVSRKNSFTPRSVREGKTKNGNSNNNSKWH